MKINCFKYKANRHGFLRREFKLRVQQVLVAVNIGILIAAVLLCVLCYGYFASGNPGIVIDDKISFSRRA